jgi:hypothetical protein
VNDSRALLCPQCGGLLPKQALWRIVNCPFCNSTVTRNTRVVLARTFHEVHRNLIESLTRGNDAVQVGGVVYRRLFQIGAGNSTQVLLCERVTPATERVILKIASEQDKASCFDDEIAALTALQAVESADSAYFTMRLPQVIQSGPTERTPGHARQVLVLRHVCGFWGSLDQVRVRHATGVDARHIVWIWRRILQVLDFVHRHGWSHGDLRPEHLLVHPRDHDILLCGWSRARWNSGNSHEQRMISDLRQSAWAMRELLAPLDQGPEEFGAAPQPLVSLLRGVSDGASRYKDQTASAIETMLQQAAWESFGTPKFIEFRI